MQYNDVNTNYKIGNKMRISCPYFKFQEKKKYNYYGTIIGIL